MKKVIYKMIIGLTFVFIMSFFYLLFLDKKMVKSLYPYVNNEVERLTNTIVHKAIRRKIVEKNYGNFLVKSDNDEESYYSYNMYQINQFKEDVTDYIQDVLSHLDSANIEDTLLFGDLKVSRFPKIKNGILAENSISSLRGSTIFGNIGPTIPIRLYFVGQVSSEIDVQTREYGINNIIIEMFLVVIIKEQVIMPVSSIVKEIKVRELFNVDIVRGNIPNYYTGFSK